MTKINIIFIATLLILLSFLSIGTVAQSSDTGSSSSSSDVISSGGSSSSDSTTGDSGTSQPSSLPSSETTPISSTTTTTTTAQTTTTDPVTTPTPTSTPEPTTPSPTTPTSPQTTPNTPNTQTTSVNQTPSPTTSVSSGASSVILPSSSQSFSSMSSIASSFMISSSGSPISSSIATTPTVTGSCAGGQQCASGQYCDSGNMTCIAVLGDGSACTSNEMCSSGQCSNSVCSAAATSNKPSSGEIAGIAVGSIGGVGVAVGVFLCLRRQRRRKISRMRGFTPSMALNGHLNDKNFDTFTANAAAAAAQQHKSDYSFTSEQAALESLSSMSMTMSPIGRQSAVYYRNNQKFSLSGTSSPFDDNETYQTMSVSSSQPVLLAAVPPAVQHSGVRSSKFDFLQNAFAKRTMPEKHPIQVSEHEKLWPTPAQSEVSSTRTSLIDGQTPSWQALVSQPPSRQGYASSDRQATSSHRMSTTTFGSGHHHVGIADDESVIDSAYSPAQSHAQPVRASPIPHNHNPFRTNKVAGPPRDAWSKEDEDGMNDYQYF